MDFTRRDIARMIAAGGAAAAFGQLARTSAFAAPNGSYRAMVGVFLFGGNDGWNMVIPTDARHAAYLAARGSVGIPLASLTPLAGAGAGYALHPALAALNPVWAEGGLNVVLNAGTLFAPITKDEYRSRADLRPTNLFSHSDEQAHWQGLRARATNIDGFMGRIGDRGARSAIPSIISLGGANLAVVGQATSPLILPATGTLTRTGYTAGGSTKNAAIDAFASGAGLGTVTDTTAGAITAAYQQATTANTILTATSTVDQYFVNAAGAALTSDLANQLKRVARLIEARGTLGHDRQTFFVTQGGYDNHSAQVGGGTNTTGTHANLFTTLGEALAAFYAAMKALGLSENVTAFTMSDFGRTYRGNAQNGTDHAWGNNHLVVGGGVRPQAIHGAYPDMVLGGAQDSGTEGRWIPRLSQEEYIGAIARWHGVPDGDLSHVFPNWATWTTGGRGPIDLFRPA